jgi:hypothetical protein
MTIGESKFGLPQMTGSLHPTLSYSSVPVIPDYVGLPRKYRRRVSYWTDPVEKVSDNSDPLALHHKVARLEALLTIVGTWLGIFYPLHALLGSRKRLFQQHRPPYETCAAFTAFSDGFWACIV